MQIKIKLLSIFILSSVLVTSVAAENKEIQRMIQQGSFQKALVLAEEQLAMNPDETQTLFLKGLILARMDRLKESAAVFIRLTEEHPELPEPYNNLAVIYAASGEYDKAEAALRQAINTHPSYATAHENLGDIYAKMASQAYNNALKLDSTNQETKEKLSMISELISAPEPEPEPAPAPAPEPEPEAEPVTVARKTEIQHPDAESLAQNNLKSAIASKKVVPEPEAVREPSFDKEAARKEVKTAVNNWAQAWSAKDADAYVKSYSAKFVPPNKLSRSRWQAQRRVRLSKPRYIKVLLDNIRIEILSQDLALVRFVQTYQSDNYKDQVNKQLLLNKVDGVWLISKEESS
jgi:tetratricopeptide (TPR) repeat protein